MKANSLKVLIIGLDGATYDLADPLIKQGRMPNFQGILNRGAKAPLKSTIPPVSSTAWGAFMTGMSAGGTSVMGFSQCSIEDYNYRLNKILTSSVFKGRTFWDEFGRSGKRVAALCVPATFPPWEVNGVMVSGFPSPKEPEKCALPVEAAAWSEGPANLQMNFKFGCSEDEIIALNREVADNTLKLAVRTLEETDPEIMVVVFSEIDKIQHNFSKFRDTDHPNSRSPIAEKYKSTIDDFYVEADERIGKLLAEIPDDCHVIVMSDHGGGYASKRFVHLNPWMEQHGWFATKETSGIVSPVEKLKTFVRSHVPVETIIWLKQRFALKESLNTVWKSLGNPDWSRTRAYWVQLHVPTSGIAINLKGRQPEGIVEPGREYEDLRDEIIGELKKLRDPKTGELIVEEIYRREELYVGKYVDTLPDIVVVFDLKYRAGYHNAPPIFEDISESLLKNRLDGSTHTMTGIFAACGPGINSGSVLQKKNILDIAPTIFHLMGFPVPSNFEGGVITEMYAPEFLESNPVTKGVECGVDGEENVTLSEEESESLRGVLKGFGYL